MADITLNMMATSADGVTPAVVSAIGTADITNDSILSADIKDAEIVNADISATAGITEGKLAIASGKILIGTAGGVGAAQTMSGDATIAANGALTVTKSTGAFAVGTTFGTGSTTTSAGAGAVAITGAIHEVTTTGTGDALTLVDGAEGQHLFVVYVAEGAGGDTAVLTPTSLAGAATTVTFNHIGDAAHLLFTAGTWFFLGGGAVVA